MRALALLLLLVPATASAEEYRPSRATQWYGWQNLTLDGLALTGVALAVATEQPEVPAYSALLLYALGSPLVHVAHRNAGGALGSVGLRVALPVAFAAVFCVYADDSRDQPCFGAVAIGGLVGATTAMAIDAGALAHGEPATPRTAGLRGIAPFASVTKSATTFGLGGAF